MYCIYLSYISSPYIAESVCRRFATIFKDSAIKAESLLLLACLLFFLLLLLLLFHDFCGQLSAQTADAIKAKFHRLVDLVVEWRQ